MNFLNPETPAAGSDAMSPAALQARTDALIAEAQRNIRALEDAKRLVLANAQLAALLDDAQLLAMLQDQESARHV